jgi:hypothetical protein
MINLAFKMALIIMTINGMFFFLGSCDMSGTDTYGIQQFSWLPASLTEGRQGGKCVAVIDPVISDSNQLTMNSANPTDRNSEITAGTGSSSQALPYYDTFNNVMGFAYDFLFNIMFGYVIWLQALGLPFAMVVAVAIPLFCIQMIGLFYLISTFLNAAGIAVGLFRGV